jgi:hypothetical protein
MHHEETSGDINGFQTLPIPHQEIVKAFEKRRQGESDYKPFMISYKAFQ